jgi:DNA-binding IclR family transcriptional regulator
MERGSRATRNGKLVPAVDRAVRLLELLATDDRSFGISELARQLDLNKATVRDILLTLDHHRLVQRDPATRRYRLGARLHELGAARTWRADLRALARPALEALRDQTGETVILGVRAGDRVLLLDVAESPHDLKITAPPGRTIPLTAGAFARVFFAYLPDDERERLLVRLGLPDYTPRSPRDPAAFRQALAAVRARRYALDREEYLAGVCAAAAPVLDPAGRPLAAVLVVGFSSRIDDQRLARLGEAARATAEQIAAAVRRGPAPWPAVLGGSPDP